MIPDVIFLQPCWGEVLGTDNLHYPAAVPVAKLWIVNVVQIKPRRDLPTKNTTKQQQVPTKNKKKDNRNRNNNMKKKKKQKKKKRNKNNQKKDK
jgi:hypothetical protein